MDRWGFTFPLDGLPLPAHREVMQQAESWGYTDAWTAEVDGADAFIPAALAASWTTKMRLGTAIVNVFTRGPALLAMETAAVAEVAPDRFCLGIGSSSPAIVENWNGVKLERPLERVRETVAFLRSALSYEKTANEALGVRGFRLSRRYAKTPPIFIAALREKMLAMTGAVGDGVILNWLAPHDVPKPVEIFRRGAQDAGRDPDSLEVACRIFVLPNVDDNMVRFIGRRAAAAYLSTPVYSAFHEWLGRGELLRPMLEAWHSGDRQGALELIPDELLHDLFVTGSRQECLDKIDSYRRNGVTLPILAFLPTTPDPKELGQRMVDTLRELGRP
ncbi:MAG: LLM class F420-dependent oxidoreductase [Dehalococcoidia bacterium]